MERNRSIHYMKFKGIPLMALYSNKSGLCVFVGDKYECADYLNTDPDELFHHARTRRKSCSKSWKYNYLVEIIGYVKDGMDYYFDKEGI